MHVKHLKAYAQVYCVELVSAKRIIRLRLLSCKHSSKPSPLIEVKCTKKIIRLYNLYLSLRPNKNGPPFSLMRMVHQLRDHSSLKY